MNVEERERLKQELIDELAKCNFRVSMDLETSTGQVVADDLVDAIFPAIIERIEVHTPASNRRRKRIILKEHARKAFVIGWNSGRRYAGAYLDDAEKEAVQKWFEDWWNAERES